MVFSILKCFTQKLTRKEDKVDRVFIYSGYHWQNNGFVSWQNKLSFLELPQVSYKSILQATFVWNAGLVQPVC